LDPNSVHVSPMAMLRVDDRKLTCSKLVDTVGITGISAYKP
jgi:hypothetical protein